MPVTKVCLSVGLERANTLRRGHISLILLWEISPLGPRTCWLKTFPEIE